MLTLQQALEAISDGFIVEALAADNEVECIIDPLFGYSMALADCKRAHAQGYELIQAGLSDGWDDIAPEDFIVPEGYDEAPKRNPNPPESTPIPAYLQGQLNQAEWDSLPF